MGTEILRDPAAIHKLKQWKMVIGLDLEFSDEEWTSECCVKGKLACKSFPSSTTESKISLEIVHTDLCGPMPVTSAGGNRYIPTFINDHSKFTMVKM